MGDPTIDEMKDRIWAEYHHAYSMLQPFKWSSTFLQASGHAQCALSLLAELREDTSQQHDDMVKVMEFVISCRGFVL